MDALFSVLAIDIRRGQETQIPQWVGNLLDLDQGPKLWERLFLIVCEDIGVGAPSLPILVWDAYQNEDNPVDVALGMARCPKTRLGSWVKTIFFSNRDWEGLYHPDGADGCTVATAKKMFSMVFRKCVGRTQSKYRSSHLSGIQEQYELFYWAGVLWDLGEVATMWEMVVEFGMFFPKVVGDAIGCLQEMDATVAKNRRNPSMLIQALTYLSQLVDWEPNPTGPKGGPKGGPKWEQMVVPQEIPDLGVPGYAYDQTTKRGRQLLTKIMKYTGWSRERTIRYGMRNYYNFSCKVEPEISVPYRIYYLYAKTIETEKILSTKKNAMWSFTEEMTKWHLGMSDVLTQLPKKTERMARNLLVHGNNVVYGQELRSREQSSRQKVKSEIYIQNTYLSVHIKRKNGMDMGVTLFHKQPEISNIDNNYIFNPIGDGSWHIVQLPGYLPSCMVVRPTNLVEIREKYYFDKLKSYLGLGVLKSFAVCTSDGWSLVYANEVGDSLWYPGTDSEALEGLSEVQAQKDLTRILLFGYYFGRAQVIYRIGGRLYGDVSPDGYVVVTEYPELPNWAMTPRGMDVVKRFKEILLKLIKRKKIDGDDIAYISTRI